jgi:uncharacterized membrane protein YbhN (UPF0104 family)
MTATGSPSSAGYVMRAWLKNWGWPICKVFLAVSILSAIGRQFYYDLHDLDLAQVTLRSEWLVLSGGLYFLALGCSAFFWYQLLRVFDQRPSLLRALRAYYLGHLGKYLPGKAWALLMRGSLVSGPDVLLGVAIITAFYEVLTTMAAGALLTAVLFVLEPPAAPDLDFHPVFLGVVLVAVLGVPLLPWVFNRLVGRLARRFQQVQSFRLEPLRVGTLVQGLTITGCGWFFLGMSLWSALQAFVTGPHPLTPTVLARYVAIMGLGYVAGFLVLVVPSGVGVREYVLQRYLVPELAAQGVGAARAVVLLAVLLLRLIWTSTELLVAAAVFWLPLGVKDQASGVNGPEAGVDETAESAAAPPP